MKVSIHRVSVIVSFCWFSLSATLATAMAAETVRFRIQSDSFGTIDWNHTASTLDSGITDNIMEGLVRYDDEMKLVPALAERWEVSPDRKKYVFHLRKDVQWSDGKPLEAAHFRDSWLRALEPGTEALYANFFFDIENAEAFRKGKIKDPAKVGVRVRDRQTLEVTLARPVSYFLQRLGFWATYPIRLDLIRKHGAHWTDPDKLATLGPYRLVSWEKGKRIVFQRYPGYHGAAPAVERVEVIVEPSAEKARELLKGGAIDFLLNPSTGDLVELRDFLRGKQGRLESFNYMSTFYLEFNLQDRVFRSLEMRKAVSDAVDTTTLAAQAQSGFSPATSFIPPQIAGHDESPRPRSSIPPRGLVQKAGFLDGAGLGRPTLWVETSDYALRLSQDLAEQLQARLGLELDVRIAPAEEEVKNAKKKRYSMYLTRWSADFPDPANFFEVFASVNGPNSSGWSNPRYNQLISRANTSSDPQERIRLYWEAESLLVTQDAVIAPLFYRKILAIIGNRLESLQVTPLNYLHFRSFRIRK